MTSPRRMTIRVKLTLWSAVVTTVVCGVVCGVLYIGFARSLEHEIDGFLSGEVHEMAALLAAHAHDRAAVQASFELELGARPRGTLVFRLKSEDGRVLISSDAAAERWNTPLPVRDEHQRVGDAHFATVRIPDLSYPIRVCALSFRGEDNHEYVAEATYALDRMISSLAMFRAVSAAALVVAVAGALAGGIIIARRSLQPIQAITRKANAIGAQHLDERLPLRGSGDELDLLAETLNHMLDRVANHVRRVRQFTADASHELRSPLAALRGNAEVTLARPRTADELKATIEQNIEHYDRLARIADDLLLLARGDAGELRMMRGVVSMTDAVRDVLDLYAPLAEELGIAFHTAFSGNAEVRGDHAYIRQLLSNLVDNAVKYAGAGRLISVDVHATEQSVELRLSDSGPGIPPEHVPHLFDRFYRVDAARSGKGPRGSGLGLPICRMIAEAHGGSIRIESREGTGTTVTVELPAACAEDSNRAEGQGRA